MSYYPCTQLYYHGSNPSYATVVTDGNVMITYGLGAGTIIKLADWLILSRGEKIHEAFTGFAPADSGSHAVDCQQEASIEIRKNQSDEENLVKTDNNGVKYYSCGCRSDGLLCDTHLYQ